RAWVGRMVPPCRRSSVWWRAVVPTSAGQLTGRCGLSDLGVENPAPCTIPRGGLRRGQGPAGVELIDVPDLGYSFDPANWGHGFATEAARCVFDYARASLRWPRIVSVIHPDNARSLRVAQRLGLPRDGPG